MSLETILQELPSLAAADLEHVRDKAAAVLAMGPRGSTKSPKQVSHDNYLLDGIAHELKRRGILARDELLQAAHRYPDSIKRAEAIWAHLMGRMPGLRAVEMAALGKLVGRTLAEWLETRSKPVAVSPGTMVRNLSNVLVALDSAFPGYLEAGLLSWCWKSHG